MSQNYTDRDKNIDKYLGTTNLRPGPPRRVINKKNESEEKEKMKIKEEKKMKINFTSYSLPLELKIKWSE